ncbi:MAG: BamA/TamA family outer membrane protein [Pseudomonadota bacterium]
MSGQRPAAPEASSTTHPSIIGCGQRTVAAWFVSAALPLAAAAQSVVLAETELPADIEGQIKAAFSAIEAPESTLGARRLGQRARSTAETVLNANGYFAPSVSARTDIGPPPRPVLTIEPGPRFEIADVSIDYGAKVPSPEAQRAVQAALTIGAGDVALPSVVIAQEGQIRAALQQSGYPDAKIVSRRAVGDKAAGTLDVRYSVETGPSVLLGTVRFNTDGGTRDTYLGRFVPFPPGTPYAPGEIDGLKRRLSQDRLFRSVQVDFDRDGTRTAPSGAEVRDVLVTLQDRRRNRVAAGVSFATDTGPGVGLTYERRNPSKRADTVSSSLIVADLQRQLAITWDRPHEFGFGRDLELAALVADENPDGFDRQRVQMFAIAEQSITPDLAFTLGVNGEVTRETRVIDPDTGDVDTRDIQTLGLIGGARIDRADNPLDPKRGWRANAAVEPTITTGEVSSQLLRLSGQVRGYRSLDADQRLVAALRVRAGSVVGSDFVDIPTDELFFGGGGGSVRGFAFQSIGPESADGRPLGGQSLLELSAELRWKTGEKLGWVGFVDAGRVTDQPGIGVDDLRYGVGVGVRYDTVAGPIRFDIATPLDRRDGENPVQVYLSIGQAF